MAVKKTSYVLHELEKKKSRRKGIAQASEVSLKLNLAVVP